MLPAHVCISLAYNCTFLDGCNLHDETVFNAVDAAYVAGPDLAGVRPGAQAPSPPLNPVWVSGPKSHRVNYGHYVQK